MNDKNDNIPILKKCAVAVRPFAYTASVTPVLLGLAITWYSGYSINIPLFALTLLGVVFFHTGANLLNDCFDHRRGLDSEQEILPTSGAIVRGWITEKQAFIAAMLLLGVGALIGVILVHLAGIVVLLLGAIGAVIALGYTRAGFCFKYRGLGDLAIFTAFGILPAFGTYWVQTQEFSLSPVLWSIPLSLLTVGILHSNNWRDINTDPDNDCITPASLLGERGSGLYYKVLMIGPFVLTVAYIITSNFTSLNISTPVTTFSVFIALPMAIKLTMVKREEDGTLFAMLDSRTAQVQLLFGILLSVSFVIARFMEGA